MAIGEDSRVFRDRSNEQTRETGESRGIESRVLPFSVSQKGFRVRRLFWVSEAWMVLSYNIVDILSLEKTKKVSIFMCLLPFDRKNWLQGLSSNDVVLGLLLANAGVFLMWRVFDQRFMINNFMVSTSKKRLQLYISFQ